MAGTAKGKGPQDYMAEDLVAARVMVDDAVDKIASSAFPTNSVYAGGTAWASSEPFIQSIPIMALCRSRPD